MIEYLQRNFDVLGIDIDKTIYMMQQKKTSKTIEIKSAKVINNKYRKCKSFFKKHGIIYNKKNRDLFSSLDIGKILNNKNELYVNEEEAEQFLDLFEFE